jgi:hypothetical protein
VAGPVKLGSAKQARAGLNATTILPATAKSSETSAETASQGGSGRVFTDRPDAAPRAFSRFPRVKN